MRVALSLALGLAVACLFCAAPAGAHVTDLSQSDFAVEGATVHALVVLAKSDAVRLGGMDPDRDGVVSPSELAASQRSLAALVERGIDVTSDGARCAPALEGGGDVEGDAFGLSVRFDCPSPPRTFSVSMAPFLERLAPAHRHLLRIRAGGETAEATLTQESPRADLHLAASTGGEASRPLVSVLRNAAKLGLVHIFTGWDHILFLLALLLGTRATGLRPVVLAVSAFTVAHSITLGLAALDLVSLSPRFVEPAIAASIVYVAFENAWRPDAPHRWRLAFGFGLVHGLGFASALRTLALAGERLLPTLIGFNLGIEAAQIILVVALVPVLHAVLPREHERARVRAASLAIGVVGLVVLALRLR